MPDLLDSTCGLGMIVSPVQGAILLVVVVLVFAPKLAGPLGRQAGRSFKGWLRAYLGMPAPRRPRPAPREVDAEPEIEIIPPKRHEHTLRAGSRASLAAGARSERRPPVWPVVAVVSASVAVLLWIVLHSR